MRIKKGNERMEKVWLWKLTPFIGFLCISLVYLNRLKKLNEILVDQFSGESSFSLLSYNNYQPVKYFGLAVLIVLISLGLGYLYIKWIRFDAYEVEEVIVSFVCLIGLLFLDISVITHINIPIFQAILSLCVFGGLVAGVMNSK